MSNTAGHIMAESNRRLCEGIESPAKSTTTGQRQPATRIGEPV